MLHYRHQLWIYRNENPEPWPFRVEKRAQNHPFAQLLWAVWSLRRGIFTVGEDSSTIDPYTGADLVAQKCPKVSEAKDQFTTPQTFLLYSWMSNRSVSVVHYFHVLHYKLTFLFTVMYILNQLSKILMLRKSEDSLKSNPFTFEECGLAYVLLLRKCLVSTQILSTKTIFLYLEH